MKTIYPVILSGGTGSRLWPMSREALPKQLLRLHGPRTMIQETVLRAAVPGAASPVLVCNQNHRFLVAEQMQEIGCTPRAIYLEPEGRNTAPAAAIAALDVTRTEPEGLVLLLPSDHVIADREAFESAVAAAAEAASAGYIVTFGMRPDAPETGYGYIETGGALADCDGAVAVSCFVEKPKLERAEAFLAGGRHLWNSGMFMFRADVFLAELTKHAPDILEGARAACDRASTDLDFVRLDPQAFGELRSISIDYAVMEKTDKAAVVPSNLGWSDVGAWAALWSLGERDDDQNVLHGDVIAHESSNCLVRTEEGKLVALVGVQDLAVVVTEDAILVAGKDSAQDVKLIVDRLKAENRSEYVNHTRVFRPWGSYETIDLGERYQVKRIVVKPGGRLSLQMHHHRAEHWVVVHGTARVTRGEDVFTLHENESTFIPMGATHRLENLGKIPLHLIEVQAGSYLGEDDIVRLEDVYGRG